MNDYKPTDIKWVKANGHLHTPYSFSAFGSVDEALDQAMREGVKVVGINDFFTTRGYAEWAAGCAERHLYPLFNIEFTGRSREEGSDGSRAEDSCGSWTEVSGNAQAEVARRFNDPANPERIYLSGKGLRSSGVIPEPYASRLAVAVADSEGQVKAMCVKINGLPTVQEAEIRLDTAKIRAELTGGMLRERHLAKALRLAAKRRFSEDEAGEKAGEKTGAEAFYEHLFGGKATSLQSCENEKLADAKPTDTKPAYAKLADAKLENEIRAKLLKPGGPAFVPEEEDNILHINEIRDIILAGGGIPTYPFLGDYEPGKFTEFEADIETACRALKQLGFHSAEFITTRNSIEVLEKYAQHLWDEGFIVTFGSEHNTPAPEPVELFARAGVPLTETLNRIGYLGACVIAAHQSEVAQGREGYLDGEGNAKIAERTEFVRLGDKIIKQTIKQLI